jgi:hypothetical protein
MAAVQPGALVPGPDVTNKQTIPITDSTVFQATFNLKFS